MPVIFRKHPNWTLAVTPERWRQIEELYHAARERGTEALAQADSDVRRAVEVLLAQDGGDDKILDRPASDLLADVTMTQLTAGTRLGPYKIERVLGAGGMGEVFEAIDTRLGRKIAIKVCSKQFSGRFEREARAISSLNHPHICTLHDIGPNYLVMELVESETLAARLNRVALAIDLALRYRTANSGCPCSGARKGIVHRDLKPGNVMLTKNGVKVLDFGLAKSAQDLTMTASNMVMGTPAYMAPEQLEGKEADSRTDIYALGLILYEMATGTRAVPGQIPPMEKLPERLGHVIERCLALAPDERWQTASRRWERTGMGWKRTPPVAAPRDSGGGAAAQTVARVECCSGGAPARCPRHHVRAFPPSSHCATGDDALPSSSTTRRAIQHASGALP